MVLLEQKTIGGFKQKWEYFVIEFDKRDETYEEKIITSMNKRGNHGWECYAVTDTKEKRGFYFKRPR